MMKLCVSANPEIALCEKGASLIELLVSMLVTVVISLAFIQGFLSLTKVSLDNEIVAQANEQARTILDYMGFDLRMTRAGIPFAQSGFQIGGTGLGDAPLPVLLDATSSHFHVRLNEKGVDTVLTADYTPTSTNLTISVFSTLDLFAGDNIYMSDLSMGGTSGMKAQIAAINGTHVTLRAGYTATAAAQFKAGCMVNHVADVIYNSPGSWSGITRNNGGGDVVLQPNTQFTISYLDGNGAVLALPLTAAVVKSNLSSARVTVTVRSQRVLSSGQIYSTTASQEVALRNLILSR